MNLRPRHREDPEINLISLIDVLLVLLIFLPFMLHTLFDFTHLVLDRAIAGG